MFAGKFAVNASEFILGVGVYKKAVHVGEEVVAGGAVEVVAVAGSTFQSPGKCSPKPTIFSATMYRPGMRLAESAEVLAGVVEAVGVVNA